MWRTRGGSQPPAQRGTPLAVDHRGRGCRARATQSPGTPRGWSPSGHLYPTQSSCWAMGWVSEKPGGFLPDWDKSWTPQGQAHQNHIPNVKHRPGA